MQIGVNVFNKYNNSNENFLISKDNELDTILEFSLDLKRLDPDIILTTGGDQILFPHLFSRSKIYNIENILLTNLNREFDQNFLIKKNRSILEINSSLLDNSNFYQSLSLSSSFYFIW